MAGSPLILLPYVYPATFAGKRSVHHDVWAVDRVPFLLPVARMEDEPLAYTLRKSPGSVIEWRIHDGRLFRQAVGRSGKPARFDDLFGNIDTRNLYKGGSFDLPWADHPGSPFLSRGEHAVMYDNKARDAVIEAKDAPKWIFEDRLTFQHRAILKASGMVLDGRDVWLEASEPVLAVYVDPPNRCVVVETLVGDTLPDTSAPAVFLRIYEEARARELAGSLSASSGFPLVDLVKDCIIHGTHEPAADTDRMFVEQLVSSLHEAFGAKRINQTELGDLTAYAMARQSLAMADAGDVSLLDTVHATLRGIAAGAPGHLNVTRAVTLLKQLDEVRLHSVETFDDTAIGMVF